MISVNQDVHAAWAATNKIAAWEALTANTGRPNNQTLRLAHLEAIQLHTAAAAHLTALGRAADAVAHTAQSAVHSTRSALY